MPESGDRRRALAKLTLSLRVVGRRPDGYHLLEAEMATVDLADELYFSPGGGVEVVDLAGAGRGAVDEGRANLVDKALRAAGRSAHVRVDKRIPVGAGLGGGSADAAAVLRWAGIRDLGLAASLGSDVPFCLSGGRALVSGAGESVEPLPFEDRPFVLLLVPVAVSTQLVYAAWDEMGAGRRGGSNDLEAAALAVEPDLASWRDLLAGVTGTRPSLAGSGSTWFVEGNPEELGLAGRGSLEIGATRAPLVAVRSAR